MRVLVSVVLMMIMQSRVASFGSLFGRRLGGATRMFASNFDSNAFVQKQASVSSEKSADDFYAHQQAVFDDMASWFADPTEAVPESLHETYQKMTDDIICSIVDANATELAILDVACGTGALWPFLIKSAEQNNVKLSITGVDLSEKMVQHANTHAELLASNSQHTINVKQGNIVEYATARDDINPNQLDTLPYDAAILNACYGNLKDPINEVLAQIQARHVFVTHPLGYDFTKNLHDKDPKTVPNLHPASKQEWITVNLWQRAPFAVKKFVNDQQHYFTHLQRVRATVMDNVLQLRGAVAAGYGRGGAKLGFPTANLPAHLFQDALANVTTGVYAGWVTLEVAAATTVYKAVVNVGYSPTFAGQENKEKIVEAHLIKNDNNMPESFYNVTMRLQLHAFVRSEIKFDGFPALVAQIKADVVDTTALLSLPPHVDFQHDEFLTRDMGASGGNDNENIVNWAWVDSKELYKQCTDAK